MTWPNHFNTLSFSFLICKLGTHVESTSLFVFLFEDLLTFCVQRSWHNVASNSHYQVDGWAEDKREGR